MRSHFTVFDSFDQQPTDVMVDIEPGTSTQEVTEALAESLPTQRTPSTATDSTQKLPIPATKLDLDVPWENSGVLNGSTMQLSPAPGVVSFNQSSPEPKNSVVLLKFIGGPRAGDIQTVGTGSILIGSHLECGIQLPEEEPSVAAVLHVSPEGSVKVERIANEATITVSGLELSRSGTLRPGTILRVQDLILEVESPKIPRADLKESENPGKLDYNRPPRILPPSRETVFRLPPPVEDSIKQSLPILMALGPIAMGLGMFAFTRSPLSLMIVFLSPLMLFASYRNSSKQSKASQKNREGKYVKTKTQIDKDCRDAVNQFGQEQRLYAPDPATAGLIATTPSPRLWERRRNDNDHLNIRVGLATQASDVVLEDPEQVEHRRKVVQQAHDTPVTVNLAAQGVLGICGPEEQVAKTGLWAIIQLAVTQSPRDVHTVVLSGSKNRKFWEPVSWLPHAEPTASSRAVAQVGSTPESLSTRISELISLIEERSGGNNYDITSEPAVIVVLDGARKLRAFPGVTQILAQGPTVGVFTICLDADERSLPEECTAIFKPHTNGTGTFATPSGDPTETDSNAWILSRQKQATITGIIPDGITEDWAQWVAHSLCPLRDASEDSESSLPGEARFLDVTMLEPPSTEAILSRWESCGRSTETTMGVSIDGPFGIDIKLDGPHGLVAGTTGAGKSELLQSMIAGWAINNRPDEMTFVLVDYKGGAAFKDLVKLTHTLGVVTDLDTRLVERAMESLGAELHRRERMLAAAGAKDIEDYQKLIDKGASLPKMARLIIIVDEFAAMKKEFPDFISGMVNIAQRGRSLGIHLILATQKPGGVITGDIQANTNLRIALRVAEASESQEVINTKDAAEISKTTPGRGYMRSGATVLVPFQTARVGGPRPSANPEGLKNPPFVIPLSSIPAGDPLPEQVKSQAEEEDVTDLQVLVDHLVEASEKAGVAKQPSPWLPALPQLLVLPTDSEATEKTDTSPFTIYLGLEDQPEKQTQKPLLWNVATDSHLLLAGSPRSGRTSTLRVILAQLAAQSATDSHIYVLDYANGALLTAAELPAVGAVLSPRDEGRLPRFIDRLLQEISTRNLMLTKAKVGEINEQRATARDEEKLPFITVIVDGYDRLISNMDPTTLDEFRNQFIKILREGPAVGVRVVLAADKALLGDKVGQGFGTQYVLPLTSQEDYRQANIPVQAVPAKVDPGRMFYGASPTREVQMYLLDAAADGASQQKAFTDALTSVTRNSDKENLLGVQRPFRVDVLPESITYTEAHQLPPAGTKVPDTGLLIGVGGDELSGHYLDWSSPSGFLIAGDRGTGKTSLLSCIIRDLHQHHVPTLVIDTRDGLAARTGQELEIPVLTSAEKPDVEKLKKYLETLGASSSSPVTVVVDNADTLSNSDLLDPLTLVVNDVRYILSTSLNDAQNTHRGPIMAARKYQTGILLWPKSPMDGSSTFGAAVPRSLVGRSVPGRAVAYLAGEYTTIQLPIPDGGISHA